MTEKKYTVSHPYKLKSWERIISREIVKLYQSPEYEKEICSTTLPGESLGPFTKFLYHLGYICDAPFGVLIDFNERTQKIYLTNGFYKYVHKLRDKILEQLARLEEINNPGESICDNCDGINACQDFGCWKKKGV